MGRRLKKLGNSAASAASRAGTMAVRLGNSAASAASGAGTMAVRFGRGVKEFRLTSEQKQANKDWRKAEKQANKDWRKAEEISNKIGEEEKEKELLEGKMKNSMKKIQARMHFRSGRWKKDKDGLRRSATFEVGLDKWGRFDADKQEVELVREKEVRRSSAERKKRPWAWTTEKEEKDDKLTKRMVVGKIKAASKKEKAEKGGRTSEEEGERLKKKKAKMRADVKKTKEKAKESDVGSLLMVVDERDKKKKKIEGMNDEIDKLVWESKNPAMIKRLEREDERKLAEMERNIAARSRRRLRPPRGTNFADFLVGNLGGGKRRKSRRKPRRKTKRRRKPRRKTKRRRKPRRKTKRRRKPRRKTKRRRKSKKSKRRRR
jgi:hypothetical protein